MMDVLSKVNELLVPILKEIINIIKSDSDVRAEFEDIQMVLKNRTGIHGYSLFPYQNLFLA